MSADPAIVIVIPTYQHSSLVSEAIATALALQGGPEFVIVAVNDGCPSAETKATLSGWARMHPGKVHHLHQANRGLSGARNAGVIFARKLYPSLEAVFLLDSDNLLDPHSMELFGHLLKSQPDKDWFYPNFDMFGIEQCRHSGGIYSPARMANSNQCEAGSLVRMRVFDAGIWFDEDMRSGYEDWNFWLTATGAGFQGAPIQQAFFRYRKRPASMLSGAHGSDSEIRAQVYKRQRWLFGGDGVARAAISDGVMYNIINASTSKAWQMTEHGTLTPVEIDTLVEDLLAHVAQPMWQRVVPYWIFAQPASIEFLTETRFGASLLCHLQTSMDKSPIATASFEASDDDSVSIEVTPPKHGGKKANDGEKGAKAKWILGRLNKSNIMMVHGSRMRWIAEAHTSEAGMGAFTNDMRPAEIKLTMPNPPKGMSKVAAALRTFNNTIHASPFKSDHLERYRIWREDPQITGVNDVMRVTKSHNFDGMPLPVRKADDAINVGFVLPILKFGGVEKCAIALARAMKLQGARCHLFIYGNQSAAATDWLFEPFETVHIVSHKSLRNWEGPRYLGTKMAQRPPEHVMSSILAPLTGMDAVINSGCAALHHGLGDLKSKGIATLAWEHLFETGPYGRNYGTPFLAIAYEGAYDNILTCSSSLADWMRGQGVPNNKLLPIPNGPGFPMESSTIRDALAKRQARGNAKPLRVGFLGRLDAQKGLDRFLKIARNCEDIDLKFSITGKSVLDSQEGEVIPASIPLHPPAYEVDDLQDAFARIDILLMPSRDEGLPLTIMEAQRVGVVPICTDVGAVAEGIDNGVNGYLIPTDDVATKIEKVLRDLHGDRTLLSKISHQAATETNKWTRNATATLDLIARKKR